MGSLSRWRGVTGAQEVPLLALLALAGWFAPAHADPDYAAECDAGRAESCVLMSILAQRAGDRAATAVWDLKAAAIYEASCTAKDRDACGKLGEVRLAAGDPAAAQTAWLRGCDLDPVTCVDLADQLAARDPEGPIPIAMALLQRSCTRDVGLGCLGYAILGSDHGADKIAVKVHAEKGLRLLGAECDGATDPARRAQACQSLADVYYFGIQVKPDRDKGIDYYRRGCTSGVECRTHATLLLAQGDEEAAVAVLRKACELGDCEHWNQACAGSKSSWCAPLAAGAPL